jgi:hypothetical protein
VCCAVLPLPPPPPLLSLCTLHCAVAGAICNGRWRDVMQPVSLGPVQHWWEQHLHRMCRGTGLGQRRVSLRDVPSGAVQHARWCNCLHSVSRGAIQQWRVDVVRQLCRRAVCTQHGLGVHNLPHRQLQYSCWQLHVLELCCWQEQHGRLVQLCQLPGGVVIDCGGTLCNLQPWYLRRLG